MIVKKQKFSEKFKNKGYYLMLFTGVLAIAMVAIIGTKISSNKDINNNSDNLTDLNNPNDLTAENETPFISKNNQNPESIVNKKNNDNQSGDKKKDVNNKALTNDELLEFDIFSEEDDKKDPKDKQDPKGNKDSRDKQNPKDKKDGDESAESKEPVVAVVNTDTPKISNLSFKPEDGLEWPIIGDILMEYNMDNTVYHKTLMQYKCSPAILIGATKGLKVKAAAKGVIKSVEKDAETGLTVTIDIGSGYTLVYGQLDNVDLKVLDQVNEGDSIGVVAAPTKYYSVEGDNLYFKVLKEEEPVNPMSMLR